MFTRNQWYTYQMLKFGCWLYQVTVVYHVICSVYYITTVYTILINIVHILYISYTHIFIYHMHADLMFSENKMCGYQQGEDNIDIHR